MVTIILILKIVFIYYLSQIIVRVKIHCCVNFSFCFLDRSCISHNHSRTSQSVTFEISIWFNFPTCSELVNCISSTYLGTHWFVSICVLMSLRNKLNPKISTGISCVCRQVNCNPFRKDMCWYWHNSLYSTWLSMFWKE